jgi:hypothetical protein
MSSLIRRCCVLLVPGCTLILAGAAAAAEFRVDLSVRESAGVDRRSEPISGGVPLPKGVFARNQGFALVKEDGSELPCQVSPLVVETDGTLRWVLLDFRDDVAAGATNKYVFRASKPVAGTASPSPAPKPKQVLKVDDTPSEVVVDTGKLRLSVSKTRPFELFDSVNVAGKVVGYPLGGRGQVSYVQMQGRSGWDDKAQWRPKKLVAGPPETVQVHYAGPLRVTIEVTGHFNGDPLRAGYRAWITAWAGSSRVWLKYTLCNSNPDRYTAILAARSAIELRLAEQPENVLLGADRPTRCAGAPAGSDGWIHQGLLLHDAYQDVAGAVKAGSGAKVLWTGNGPKERPAGWIAATGAAGTVFVCDQLFSTNPARRLAVTDGKIILEGIAERFEGPKDQKFKRDRPIGQPWQAEGFWLYDCSHHTSEYLLDFAAPGDPAALDRLAKAARNRLWALAPGEYYSQCQVLGTGRFGTLADEETCYKTWGWTFRPAQVPNRWQPVPGAFVAWEDNHYESEADSVQGLLLMYLRTGQRGWFDLAQAWARYHMDLQAWRTDGWRWKDGAIWFPQGGPQGNRPQRAKWNFQWGPSWGERKDSPDCADLWRLARAKSCYCHYYGSGLADYFCLTGDRDALDAAIDNVEQKDSEFRRSFQFTPHPQAGTPSPVGSIRGFGRGFEVMMRVLQVDPQNQFVRDLCRLSARTLWQSPLLDERGFHCSHIGGGFGGMAAKEISPNVKKWMDKNGIKLTTVGAKVDGLSKGEKNWKVRCMGGTWQHVYIQNGADLYARYFDDEDMRDFVIAFAQLSARYMLSPKCHQTWYYTYFDVPDLGMVFDPWVFDHTDTRDGEGCVHEGWYTRFYPDACAKGYSLTGEKQLLEKAKEFWYYGSKRGYRTKRLSGGKNEVGMFAGHTPPKDDTVLEVSRLLYEASHPRRDDQPPAAVTDLRVKLLEGDRAEIRFTAPADAGGGKVVHYQVKAAELPIVPYQEWDYARDAGKRRNWWRAVNCKGEPAPSPPGTKERFVVSGLPPGDGFYFAVRSFDQSSNRSPMSNVCGKVGREQ